MYTIESPYECPQYGKDYSKNLSLKQLKRKDKIQAEHSSLYIVTNSYFGEMIYTHIDNMANTSEEELFFVYKQLARRQAPLITVYALLVVFIPLMI